MTICKHITEFETTLETRFLGTIIKRKIKIDIKWISFGLYSLQAKCIEKKRKKRKKELEFRISLAPEWIEKVIELYPEADRRSRTESHKPFYEKYDINRCMIFDMGQDILFQAFKHPLKETVTLTNLYFNHGEPMEHIDVFSVSFEEFKRLKEVLDDPNGKGSETLHSGCSIRRKKDGI
jgi:hypothetical protein